MSMVFFELSRELHEQEKVVRGIQIADADSLCNYLKGFWEFIYNHKMFGCVYDIYSDDIELYRENGFVLHKQVSDNIEDGLGLSGSRWAFDKA